MPKFEVIKAHDGLSAGTIKDVPADANSAYMVENGYWREVVEEQQKKTDAAQPATKPEPAAAPASVETKKNRRKRSKK